MITRSSKDYRHPAEPLTSVNEMLNKAWIESQNAPNIKPRAFQAAPTKPGNHQVISVQRMTLPAGRDAEWATQEYIRWLPRSFWGILPIAVKISSPLIQFHLWGLQTPLLTLSHYGDASDAHRQVLFVKGGFLARPNTKGRLEFRQVCDDQTLLVALVHFEPTLPWWLYRFTQAIAHKIVMYRFQKHLRSI